MAMSKVKQINIREGRINMRQYYLAEDAEKQFSEYASENVMLERKVKKLESQLKADKEKTTKNYQYIIELVDKIWSGNVAHSRSTLRGFVFNRLKELTSNPK